jgi:NADH:ubiquinone oxidoreductase subunit 4 (subunit M)
MVIMMAALLWLGLYPQPVFDLTQPVLEGLQPLIVNVPETLAGNIPGGTP